MNGILAERDVEVRDSETGGPFKMELVERWSEESSASDGRPRVVGLVWVMRVSFSSSTVRASFKVDLSVRLTAPAAAGKRTGRPGPHDQREEPWPARPAAHSRLLGAAGAPGRPRDPAVRGAGTDKMSERAWRSCIRHGEHTHTFVWKSSVSWSDVESAMVRGRDSKSRRRVCAGTVAKLEV
ncbi:hypothetical protein VFPFJ_01135 [Purpureocillium lilacinum]|uniref:Uncharacterized protein n=1 Tax=Purpureocillium lilacinum TaxID=33203 RepID=A0A179HWX9_PURLI|nr:hypothetical protein VFPFJ_01135 [Purpureocillium lilacinum]OAQ95026.1 hypothetical protein VFPFJ_01135 [Purpureocillium lilacinum]